MTYKLVCNGEDIDDYLFCEPVVYDLRYWKENNPGWRVLNAFGAKLTPFVGVYDENKIIKGFYTEDMSINDLRNWYEVQKTISDSDSTEESSRG